MAPKARDRDVLLSEMTKLHRVEQSKVAHQNVSRAERGAQPNDIAMEGGRKGRRVRDIFFPSFLYFFLKIHDIDVHFTSQDCKSGVERPVGGGTYIQDEASSVVSS